VRAGALDVALDGAASLPILRHLALALAGIALALAVAALLVLSSGKNPLVAYGSLVAGALGSWDRVAVALNKATPYLLTGAGVALCFRAKVINIGGEGQIALGGLAATWVALAMPDVPGPDLADARPRAGCVAGAGWAALAALIRLTRNVHEVLVTLLMNFVGVLLVGEALHGDLGEPGAGFPQSPLLARAAWLPKLCPAPICTWASCSPSPRFSFATSRCGARRSASGCACSEPVSLPRRTRACRRPGRCCQ
jgi:simple sugar transport system permease protein